MDEAHTQTCNVAQVLSSHDLTWSLQHGSIGQSNYLASKGGMISMTKTFALELAR